jgi:hypothetical protein
MIWRMIAQDRAVLRFCGHRRRGHSPFRLPAKPQGGAGQARAAKSLGAVVLVSLCSLGFACGKKEDTAAAPSGPIVGVLDLALSARNSGSAPSDAHEVELAANALNLGGQPVLTLTDGVFAPADRSGDVLPKLKDAFAKSPHSKLAFSVSSSIPYSSAALVLSTAKSANVQSVSFKVRPPGSQTNTGYLTLDNFTVRAKTKNDEDVAIAGATPRPWSDFTSQWEAVQTGCRGAPSGNCAFKPESIAEGGTLRTVLHAAGQGVNVAFFRVGAPPPPPPAAAPEKPSKKGKGKAKNAKKSKNVDPVAEVEQAPPATEAAFQFRSQEAVSASSAVSETTRPVCGQTACAVAVQGEKATLFVRLLSLIGAAFPDRTPAPIVAFELP